MKQPLVSRGENGNIKIHPEMLLRCRKGRKAQTKAEIIVWEMLRNKKFYNLKFRRQHHIPQYIADFYCHEKKVIVELDGEIHKTQKEYDRKRDAFLKENNFKVLRVWNHEVLNTPEKFLKKLFEFVFSPSSVPLSGTSSPQGRRKA